MSEQLFQEESFPREDPPLVLKLYVAGMTPRSRRAIEALSRIAEEYLKGNDQIEIIDIYQNPGLAREQQLVVVPTLIKESPPPQQRFIGDLTNGDVVLRGLGLQNR